MTPTDVKILNKMSGANVAFFVCEKLRENGLHICDKTIVDGHGEELPYDDEMMRYCVEKMFFNSGRYQTKIDVADLVVKYRYIFKNELSSPATLVSMLLTA